MQIYDVVIVGAGPAGCIAAKVIAGAGLKVLVLEKDQEVGEPIRCAGGIMADDLKKFMEHVEGHWLIGTIKGFKLYSPGGYAVEFKPKEAKEPVGYVLDRKAFDQELARQAAALGAEIWVKANAIGLIKSNNSIYGVKVNQLGRIIDITAKIVIGADGVESQVARWAGIDTAAKPEQAFVAAQYLIFTNQEPPPQLCELYVGNKIAPGGYIWVLPRFDGCLNVGVGVLAGAAEEPAIKYLEEFIRRRFKSCAKLELVVGGQIISASGGLNRKVASGLMIIGDAAHQAEPITGGGIASGMAAGRIAGEVAVEAINCGNFSAAFLSKYERVWQQNLGNSFIKNRRIRDILTSLSDEQIDKLSKSLSDIDLAAGIRFMDLTKILFRLNPKILWQLRGIF